MMIATPKKLLTAAVAYSVVVLAHAQPASENKTVSKNDGGVFALEEVIVSAQKKTESLQDTPISITALSAQQLETYGINNVADLSGKVPSLTIDPFPLNPSSLRLFIRGVGLTDTQMTQDPPVGVYLDGVYIARSTGLALDVADLERIEVLRGPQGTLYGRNTTAGAINLITRRPNTEELEFTSKVGVSDRDGHTYKAILNVPVFDDAAFKLAWLDTAVDGFVENTGPGGNFGDSNNDGYRLDMRWDITDKISVDYAYDESKLGYYTYTYQPVLPNGGGIFGPNLADRINYSDNRLDKLETTAPLLKSHSRAAGHAFHVTWQAMTNMDVRYIFADRKLRDKNYFDMGGGAGLPDYRLDNGAYTSGDGTVYTPKNLIDIKQDQSSHELQFLGTLFDSRIDYVAGAYYFEENGSERKMPGGVGHLLTAPQSIVETPTTKTTDLLVALGGYDNPIKNDAWAVYSRFTWTPPVMDDRLHLTLGGRYSEDTRKASKNQQNQLIFESRIEDLSTGEITYTPAVVLPQTQINVNAEDSFHDDSYEFIAEYDWFDDVNVFAKWVEGYKSGGFNTRDPDPERFAEGFQPEKIESMELGIKSEWFDRQVRLNATAFWSDYKDIQVNFLLPNSISDTQVVNAGKAEMRGVEAELTWLVSQSLVFGLNYAYLDADMVKVIDPQTGADVTDDFQFFSAPSNSFAASLDYTYPAFSWANLDANLTYNYTSARAGSSLTSSGDKTKLDSYGVLSARLALSSIKVFSGEVSVAAWAHNMLDEDYNISAVDNQPSSSRAVLWGEPRSYGLDIVYRY
jgi:iron complex outermembrane receptor protein